MDFWSNHGIWFIIFMCFFPRLTMLFATVWGGWLWWLGWVFAPRITVAVLATLYYLDTNPVLVVFAWIWALGGESTEKGSCSIVPMGASMGYLSTKRRNDP